MKNLIDFITKHYHWFIFLLLEVMSLILLFGYNSYQNSTWVSTSNRIAGAVYGGESKILSFFSLTKINEELTARNTYLQFEADRLKEEIKNMGADSMKIAGLVNPSQYNIIPAKVVSNSVHKKDNLITINKGEADGVRKDMGVVSGNGVVGIVFMTGAHYSIVIPVLSNLSSISCKIDRRGYFGYLKWEGGARNLAYVDDIPRHAHFKLYDRVVTSGYSSVFPPGIGVGKIIHVYNSADGISYRLQVQLYTDFSNLRDVMVIDNAPMKEQLELLHQAQDSLSVIQKQ